MSFVNQKHYNKNIECKLIAIITTMSNDDKKKTFPKVPDEVIV